MVDSEMTTVRIHTSPANPSDTPASCCANGAQVVQAEGGGGAGWGGLPAKGRALVTCPLHEAIAYANNVPAPTKVTRFYR